MPTLLHKFSLSYSATFYSMQCVILHVKHVRRAFAMRRKSFSRHVTVGYMVHNNSVSLQSYSAGDDAAEILLDSA